METLTLIPHPDHLPERVSAVQAAVIGLDRYWLRLRWRVENSAGVVLPAFAGRGRGDGLWQRTCFELFVRAPEAASYAEFNLAPSEQWAAYDFAGYREGRADRPMPRDPDCTVRRGGNVLIFDASLPMAGLPPLPWEFGLSAVIEEEGGPKSLWALRHGAGKADFHADTCFAARLAAPRGP